VGNQLGIVSGSSLTKPQGASRIFISCKLKTTIKKKDKRLKPQAIHPLGVNANKIGKGKLRKYSDSSSRS
jgi:hypothetical protein